MDEARESLAVDGASPCLRCGKVILLQNGGAVTCEVVRGLLFPVHEMCLETDVGQETINALNEGTKLEASDG